jgi:tRNA dimethylallyltransferase
VIAVLGPTASGKSTLAMELAERCGGEIVSVDSMQVYREMDIGTAKPSLEDQRKVPHHLVDIVEPSREYSVAEFQEAGRGALESIAARATTAIVCGGSGLHFRALVDPLDFPPDDPGIRADLEARGHQSVARDLLEADPGAAKAVDMANPRRVLRAMEIYLLTGLTPTERFSTEAATAVRSYEAMVEFAAVGVDPGEGLDARVCARLDAMLEAGWADEARRLEGRLSRTAAAAVGYKELIAAGDDIETAREVILSSTLSLAKRQRTFFRRDPRIRWLPWDDDPNARIGSALAALQEAGAWSS